jgi:hypothetical protein
MRKFVASHALDLNGNVLRHAVVLAFLQKSNFHVRATNFLILAKLHINSLDLGQLWETDDW